MTIAEAINTAKSKLSKQFEHNELRALSLLLLQHIYKIKTNDFYVEPRQKLNPAGDADFLAAIDSLQKHKPLQYIFGEARFCGLSFTVNENVLIPRPETEELVAWILSENRNAKHIIDIGTGSGCIAVALGKELQNAKIAAIDISPKAIETAETNAQNNFVKIDFACADIFDQNILPNQKFDCIVSNPPYVRRSEMQQMQANVTNYEPHTALFVPDENALVFYKAIAEFGLAHLAKGGKIYAEINEFLSRETAEVLRMAKYKNVEIRKDLSGKPRMIKAEI